MGTKTTDNSLLIIRGQKVSIMSGQKHTWATEGTGSEVGNSFLRVAEGF
jgi:hypothetical protein